MLRVNVLARAIKESSTLRISPKALSLLPESSIDTVDRPNRSTSSFALEPKSGDLFRGFSKSDDQPDLAMISVTLAMLKRA